MLKICIKTEIPPKPNTKDVIIIFIEIAFMWMQEIWEIPFVISKKPINIGLINEDGICKKLKKGAKKIVKAGSIWLSSKIDIITENKTTKPPIIKSVEVAFDILVAIIEPKLENEISLLFCGLKWNADKVFFFQNLNIKPTVRQAKIWDISKRIPIVLLPYIVIPIVPIIKSGPRIICKT